MGSLEAEGSETVRVFKLTHYLYARMILLRLPRQEQRFGNFQLLVVQTHNPPSYAGFGFGPRRGTGRHPMLDGFARPRSTS